MVHPAARRGSNLITISICSDYILETFSVGKQHHGIKKSTREWAELILPQDSSCQIRDHVSMGCQPNKPCWVSLTTLPTPEWGSDCYCGCWLLVQAKSDRGLGLCRREFQHPIQFEASWDQSPFPACLS